MLEEIPFLKNGLSSEYNVTDYVGWSSFCLTLSLHEDITLDWSLLTESTQFGSQCNYFLLFEYLKAFGIIL